MHPVGGDIDRRYKREITLEQAWVRER